MPNCQYGEDFTKAWMTGWMLAVSFPLFLIHSATARR